MKNSKTIIPQAMLSETSVMHHMHKSMRYNSISLLILLVFPLTMHGMKKDLSELSDVQPACATPLLSSQKAKPNLTINTTLLNEDLTKSISPLTAENIKKNAVNFNGLEEWPKHLDLHFLVLQTATPSPIPSDCHLSSVMSGEGRTFRQPLIKPPLRPLILQDLSSISLVDSQSQSPESKDGTPINNLFIKQHPDIPPYRAGTPIPVTREVSAVFSATTSNTDSPVPNLHQLVEDINTRFDLLITYDAALKAHLKWLIKRQEEMKLRGEGEEEKIKLLEERIKLLEENKELLENHHESASVADDQNMIMDALGKLGGNSHYLKTEIDTLKTESDTLKKEINAFKQKPTKDDRDNEIDLLKQQIDYLEKNQYSWSQFIRRMCCCCFPVLSQRSPNTYRIYETNSEENT